MSRAIEEACKKTMPKVVLDQSMRGKGAVLPYGAFAVVSWTLLIVTVAVILRQFPNLGNSANASDFVGRIVMVGLAVIAAFMAFVFTLCWHYRSLKGYRVWWWRDSEGAVHVSAVGYPKEPQGLVLELTVRNIRPRVRRFWGVDQWYYAGRIDESVGNYFMSGRGVRILVNHRQTADFGLTNEAKELLSIWAYWWKLRPIEGGRAIRFTETSRGSAAHVLDMSAVEFAQFPEILRSGSYALTQARLQELAVLRGRSQEHDLLVDFLLKRLAILQNRVRAASRLKSKIATREDCLALMRQLHEVLPSDDRRREREGCEINEEAIVALEEELAQLRRRQEAAAPATAVAGTGA